MDKLFLNILNIIYIKVDMPRGGGGLTKWMRFFVIFVLQRETWMYFGCLVECQPRGGTLGHHEQREGSQDTPGRTGMDWTSPGLERQHLQLEMLLHVISLKSKI